MIRYLCVIVLIMAGCDAKIEILIGGKEITNVKITDKETGFLIGNPPCTLTVKSKSTLRAVYDVVNVSNYCLNHKECESCYETGHNNSRASQLYYVDGDGVFNVGKK